MKKDALFLIVALLYQVLCAVPCRWEAMLFYSFDTDDTRNPVLYIEGLGDSPSTVPEVVVRGNMVTYQEGGQICIKQLDMRDRKPHLALTLTDWYFACYGDYVAEETLDSLTRLPLTVRWDDWTATGGAPIQNPADFYLAFAAPGTESQDGIPRYGWVHLSMDPSDETLSTAFLGWGIGAFGEGVSVGVTGTPEPSSALLCLLGLAVLGLRRKSGSGISSVP